MENNLNFKWDKKEEKYVKEHLRSRSAPHAVKDVETYLNFLVEIEPAHSRRVNNKIADKKFTL